MLLERTSKLVGFRHNPKITPAQQAVVREKAIELNVTLTFIPATPSMLFSTDKFWCVPFLFIQVLYFM